MSYYLFVNSGGFVPPLKVLFKGLTVLVRTLSVILVYKRVIKAIKVAIDSGIESSWLAYMFKGTVM